MFFVWRPDANWRRRFSISHTNAFKFTLIDCNTRISFMALPNGNWITDLGRVRVRADLDRKQPKASSKCEKFSLIGCMHKERMERKKCRRDEIRGNLQFGLFIFLQSKHNRAGTPDTAGDLLQATIWIYETKNDFSCL